MLGNQQTWAGHIASCIDQKFQPNGKRYSKTWQAKQDLNLLANSRGLVVK